MGGGKPEGCLREHKKENFQSGDDIYAVATTSATSRIIDRLGVQHGYVFFTGDATNAFWQVAIDEECFMVPPQEWLKKREEKGGNTKVKWKLKKEWYGRRIAGNRWVEWFAGKLKKNGCDKCIVASWFFTRPNGIHLEMHMDDIYGCGPGEKVKVFLEGLKKDVKTKGDAHRHKHLQAPQESEDVCNGWKGLYPTRPTLFFGNARMQSNNFSARISRFEVWLASFG